MAAGEHEEQGTGCGIETQRIPGLKPEYQGRLFHGLKAVAFSVVLLRSTRGRSNIPELLTCGDNVPKNCRAGRSSE